MCSDPDARSVRVTCRATFPGDELLRVTKRRDAAGQRPLHEHVQHNAVDGQ